MGNPKATASSSKNKKKKKNSEPEAHAAARAGDLQKLQSICSSNPLAVNFRDYHSRTPLHLAAWSGHTEVVNYFCKNKADVGAAAMDDTGAIHFASQKGHLDIVRTLLASGVSVKVTNRKGFTPLHYAVQGSHVELVKYLVRKGANISAKTKGGQTPLDLASSEDIQLFLEETEKKLKKGEKTTASEKAEGVEEKQSLEGDDNGSDAKELQVEDREEDDVREKRRADEGSDKRLSASKKAKVSLQHLVDEDYAQDVDGDEE